MAFFISETTKTFIARPERAIYDPATGRRVNAERSLFVKFRRREAPLWAREVGVREFQMVAKPPHMDAAEWVSFVDTLAEQQAHGWSDDEREIVDNRLRSERQVIEVHVPVPEAPWRNYGDLTAKQNLDLAVKTATPVSELISYEQQTRNDPKVIAEYQSVLDTQAEIEQVVEA